MLSGSGDFTHLGDYPIGRQSRVYWWLVSLVKQCPLPGVRASASRSRLMDYCADILLRHAHERVPQRDRAHPRKVGD